MRLRLATPDDEDAITTLIGRSIHGLSAGEYDAAQRAVAVGSVFLVDPGLIADGTYYVVEIEGRLAGAGGWSTRRVLHGGQTRGDTGARVDPAHEPARIRAYYVDPDFARRGVGTALLVACEAAARAAGFSRAAMGATLTGLPLYTRHGYVERSREKIELAGDMTLTIVHMDKALV